MDDKILSMFFEVPRWEKAINKGVDKGIRKDQLILLCGEETRVSMAGAMRDGRYEISPPHVARIPKDNGDFRTVYVNEPIDRVFLSIANDLLFELVPEMVHPSCKSYQSGIGCGEVVVEASRRIVEAQESGHGGMKADLSRYFDSVPIRYIDEAFDRVEERHGKSAVIDVLRKYYHSDLYFDEDNVPSRKYQSLKQGCAVASWLADVVLYDIDEELSSMDGFYVRYSDDMLFIGRDCGRAMETLERKLSERSMSLNPDKVEEIAADRWFTFLGFSVRGNMRSLSPKRIKAFQREIEARTVRRPGNTERKAVDAVNRYLYKGCGEFSWAAQVLPVCNSRHDIDELNKFVMDCIRAVSTGKGRVGGLGFAANGAYGCVVRGKGRNVTANRAKTGRRIEGYLSIGCMRNAMLTSRAAYNTLAMSV